MSAEWCALDKEGKIERVREACRAIKGRGRRITYDGLAFEIGVSRGVIAGIYSRAGNEIDFPVEGTQWGKGRQNKPKLRVITNEKKIIEDFIAKNGVRRFERGDSGHVYAIVAFLRERGWHLNYRRWKYKLSRGDGAARAVAWSDVMDLVDKLRAAEGLEPILRRGTAA